MKVTITKHVPIVREFAKAEGEEKPKPEHLGWDVNAEITAKWGATSSGFFLELPASATTKDFEKAILAKYGN